MQKLPPRSILLAVLMGGCAAACCPATPAQPGPDQTLRAYAGHLRAGRVRQAHQMLSSRKRQAASAEALERFVASGGDALRDRLAALDATRNARVELRARVGEPGKETILLVQENGSWKVDGGPVVPPLGFSPQSALERFLRAAEAGDCEALVASAPPQARTRHEHDALLAGCREQVESLQRTAARIRASKGRLVQVAPDRYELVYHQQRKLVVVEYNGRWYVQDL